MVMLLESENLIMQEFQTAKNKVSYMAPAFKQKAMLHILDGDITTAEEFDSLMADLENGADVFAFADDQVAALAAAGALDPIENAAEIRAANLSAAVELAISLSFSEVGKALLSLYSSG